MNTTVETKTETIDNGVEVIETVTTIKKTKKVTTGKTYLGLVLDGSGSMGGTASDVVGGVNFFIDEQKKNTSDEALLSILAFDDNQYPIATNVPIQKAEHVTMEQYFHGGGTALNDAVMKMVSMIESSMEKNNRVFLTIYTDGFENSSKEFPTAGNRTVKDKLTSLQEKNNWTVNFVGADLTKQQTFSMASNFGVRGMNTVSYDKADTQSLYAGTSASASAYRRSGGEIKNFAETVYNTISDSTKGDDLQKDEN